MNITAQQETVGVSLPKFTVQQELSKYIITSKYARYDEEKKRRETWDEATDRVLDMHLKKFSHLPNHKIEVIKEAFEYVKDKKVVPSMRSMQFGGKAIEAHNARSFNCCVTHLSKVRDFAEIFYLLLCGCGVGVGISKRHTSKLPKLISPFEGHPSEEIIWIVEDTIEGWADSVEVLVSSYLQGNQYSGKVITFDYSKIRPEGARLVTGGGKAPGSKGLENAHEKINFLLSLLFLSGLEQLRPIHVYDIIMHCADAVLSGGVRRSAVSVIFDKDDEEMMNAKTGNWFEHSPQRARSNNSVLLIRDQVSEEEFQEVVKRTREWGEPGFVFANHEDALFNPCFEISFIPIADNGDTGIQFCNLTSVNGAMVRTKEDFYKCIEMATIIGTLQASYTNFPYLSETARRLTEEEALLGVSIIGMLENPNILLDDNIQQVGAKLAVEVNKEWANLLGINQASRVTCIKPDGTCSLAVGTMFSGIHPAHSRKMLRRVQANKNDLVYQFFKMHNPELCEESVWSANKTDDVIMFPIEVPEHSIVKEDLDALTHLEIIRKTQENWVLSGTTDCNKKDVTHNVSCTVIVKEDEWESVINYLYNNRSLFAAVSLLPDTGDKKYQQAPMEAIKTSDEESLFYNLLKNFQQVDYTLLPEEVDSTTLKQEMACVGGACEI